MRTNSQAGLSSFSVIIVTIVTLLGITGVAFASGGAMFTPGSLSAKTGAPLGGITSHAEIQQCSACHAAPWGTETMADRCLTCHTDITAQLQDPTSLHSLIRFGQTDLNCRKCHTEHHGPTASLTRIPPGWDPHQQLGFSLKAHRLRMDGTPFECKDCHENGYSGPFDQNVCANCHLKIDPVFAQQHILTFWTDCQACHDGIDTHGKNFDHNQVPFHLVGIHALTECSKCHVNARKLSDLQAVSQDCFTCHAKDDKHEGRFGTKCRVCHTAEGWSKSAQFDHDLANFKLRGLHLKVACTNCHINNVYKGIPMDCFSCHAKDDKHAGAFGPQCELCHVADGWNRAVDHSKFAFKLDGKHTTVACESCHINAVFIGTPMECASCHKKDDAHAGQLGDQCGSCHTTENWTSATFDHNSVSFKLTAHKTKSNGAAFVCKDCHLKNYASPFDQNVCGNCHLQINQAFAAEHFLTFGTNCKACHDGIDSHGSNFNHNRVPFNLVGKHALAACSNCHLNDRIIADMQATLQQCYSCHQKDDFHNGQFGQDCAACHSPEGWVLAKVDHSKFAFHLDGQHAAVACEKCHINGVFKGTPQDCASCHTKDDAHQGTYGNQCATCHNPSDWKQVAFDHNTTRFALNAHQTKTGGAPFECKDCHQNGFVSPFDQNTCGNCHLQINQTFATEHFLTFGTNCVACHDGMDSHGKAFDHNKVPFNLIGKHVSVACSQCHIAARNLHDLKVTSQVCFSCHAKDDHHNGQFGTDCAACHTPEGWQLATVDHSLFAFHLDGKHAAVACESCHQGGVFKGTPMDCTSCHSKNDPHGGALGNQCQGCHTPKGWKPSSFDHNSSIFKLTGQHVNVLCSNCHTDLKFKGTPTNCAACHSKNDPHAGKLGTDCASCHTTNGWTPSTFDHSRSAFALTGQHTTVACSQCHLDKFFVGTPKDCASCHSKNDPHGGALGNQCDTCHSTSGWKPSSFNHNNSIFKLTGQHSSVACTSCHTDLKFKGMPTNCYSCHAKDDHHNGTFGQNCAACHSTSAWKPSTFDHAKSAFPLTGAHTSVICTIATSTIYSRARPQTVTPAMRPMIIMAVSLERTVLPVTPPQLGSLPHSITACPLSR